MWICQILGGGARLDLWGGRELPPSPPKWSPIITIVGIKTALNTRVLYCTYECHSNIFFYTFQWPNFYIQYEDRHTQLPHCSADSALSSSPPPSHWHHYPCRSDSCRGQLLQDHLRSITRSQSHRENYQTPQWVVCVCVLRASVCVWGGGGGGGLGGGAVLSGCLKEMYILHCSIWLWV